MFLFLFLFLRVINAENQFEIFYTAFSDQNYNKEGWHIESQHSTTLFSQCGNQTLFGGFLTFSSNTLISYNASLPPHYQIKISFNFWKIDSWNDEKAYILCDDYLQMQQYSMSEGYPICGTDNKYSHEKEVSFEIQMNHTSKYIFIIITSNLDDDAENESWGISEFKIEILKCPKGCMYCLDDINPCDFWIHFKSFLQTPSEFDEWKKDENIILSSSLCAGLNIAGGISILGINQTIQNAIFNLSAHFLVQVELKLWLFGNQLNGSFILKLDDYQLLEEPLNQSGPIINCNYTKQQVSLMNFRAQMNHSQQSMKITISIISNSNSSQLNYWGINAFELYLGKCSINCEKCFGPGQKECTACNQDWALFQGECFYYDKILPLTCNHISIVQQLQKISNNINPIYFKSDQIAQQTLQFGEK